MLRISPLVATPLFLVAIASTAAAQARAPRAPIAVAPRPAPTQRPALAPDADGTAWVRDFGRDMRSRIELDIRPEIAPRALEMAERMSVRAVNGAELAQEIQSLQPSLTELTEVTDLAGVPFVHAVTRMRTVPPSAWASVDPADSLYRLARESLNSGDYRKAAQLFGQIQRQFPSSAYQQDAAYWRAFALYRIGGVAELHEALRALDSVRVVAPSAPGAPAAPRAPKSSASASMSASASASAASAAAMSLDGQEFRLVRMRSDRTDAAVLATRIRGALAARGDATAARQVAAAANAGTESCDDEDSELRVEALNALAQLDPGSADPTIAKVLARRDACSVPLRRGAVALIGRSTDTRGSDMLISTARTDPSWEVRAEAVQWLGHSKDPRVTGILTEIATSAERPSLQRTAVRALVAEESPAGQQALRSLLARTDVATDVRVTALHYLGKSALSVAELAKMYDASADREMRDELIQLLERRPEPQAADKLIEIARIGTDPSMRRSAIAALSRRKDPRTSQLLTEILNK